MAEPREPAGGVDWQSLEAEATAENRPEVVDSLRQLRTISRFNSALIQRGNPATFLPEEEQPAPPSPRRGRRWAPLLVGAGLVLAAVILYLVSGRPG